MSFQLIAAWIVFTGSILCLWIVDIVGKQMKNVDSENSTDI